MPLSKQITKEELLEKLRELSNRGDTEDSHSEADFLLLDYINDEEIREAFVKIERWYA